MEILSKRIACEKTLALIRKALKAGHVELGRVVKNDLIGIPKGSILSPLLNNVYLDILDKFIIDLKQSFDKGKNRRKSKEYRKIQYLIESRGLNKDLRKKI